MDQHHQEEMNQFFKSIALEIWIEPLKKIGVWSLKFLYLNYEDIFNDDDNCQDDELRLLLNNRLHRKIILKHLKQKFDDEVNNNNQFSCQTESNLTNSKLNVPNPQSNLTNSQLNLTNSQSNLTSPQSNVTNSQSNVTNPQSNVQIKQEDNSFNDSLLNYENGQTQDNSIVNDQSQLNLRQRNLDESYGFSLQETTLVNVDGIKEAIKEIMVAQPNNPIEQRFLEDYKLYGQICFFDVATYQVNLPEYLNYQTNANPEQIKEAICEYLFREMLQYFMWRAPIRILNCVLDRFIQKYPFWDDQTPTKTETFKKRILVKYMIWRRQKIPPNWVTLKCISLRRFNDSSSQDLNLDLNQELKPTNKKKKSTNKSNVVDKNQPESIVEYNS